MDYRRYSSLQRSYTVPPHPSLLYPQHHHPEQHTPGLQTQPPTHLPKFMHLLVGPSTELSIYLPLKLLFQIPLFADLLTSNPFLPPTVDPLTTHESTDPNIPHDPKKSKPGRVHVQIPSQISTTLLLPHTNPGAFSQVIHYLRHNQTLQYDLLSLVKHSSAPQEKRIHPKTTEMVRTYILAQQWGVTSLAEKIFDVLETALKYVEFTTGDLREILDFTDRFDTEMANREEDCKELELVYDGLYKLAVISVGGKIRDAGGWEKWVQAKEGNQESWDWFCEQIRPGCSEEASRRWREHLEDRAAREEEGRGEKLRNVEVIVNGDEKKDAHVDGIVKAGGGEEVHEEGLLDGSDEGSTESLTSSSQDDGGAELSPTSSWNSCE